MQRSKGAYSPPPIRAGPLSPRGSLNEFHGSTLASTRPTVSRKALAPLVLGALGVVFGDIGTSPLYAFKECFSPEHGIVPTPANVVGLLSLITWSMAWVIAFKYLSVMMRADNNGEGGILALLALALRGLHHEPRMRWFVVSLGIFGAAMFYGDSMITPAISVLSAVEGLEIAVPGISHAVIPITIGILTALFLIQRHGTGSVGAFFGPVTAIWFLAIARRRPSPESAITPTSSSRSIRRTRCRFSSRTRCWASSCWGPSSSCSRAARRSTPTWGTSAAARSASRGFAS